MSTLFQEKTRNIQNASRFLSWRNQGEKKENWNNGNEFRIFGFICRQ